MEPTSLSTGHWCSRHRCCPSPRVVHEAYKRYLDFSNQAPVYHRNQIGLNIETARRRLAMEFGADPEEIAVTRNASESLQIAQESLDLKAGDEVIITDQDYHRTNVSNAPLRRTPRRCFSVTSPM